MVITNFEKFKLLLWKNWLLQWNQKIQLILELVLPVIFSLLLVLVRILVKSVHSPDVIYNMSFPVDNLDLMKMSLVPITQTRCEALKIEERQQPNIRYGPNPLKFHLAFSPNTSEVFENIVKEAAGSLELTYSGYADAKSLEKELIANNYLAGVEFQDSLAQITKYPKKLVYSIRFPSELRTATLPYLKLWFTNFLFLPLDMVGPRNVFDPDGGTPAGYLREGFLPVQNAISSAFIRQSAGNLAEPLPPIFLQRFPHPEYNDDILLMGLSSMIAMIILLSYIYPSTYTVRNITTEKEKQLKEVMKIMGLQSWLHWMAWFVKGVLMMGFSSFLITCVLLIRWTNGVAVLTYSSFTAVFFFFLVYAMTTLTLCFMLATFFSKASTAAAVTGLVWFIMFIPYTLFELSYNKLDLATKVVWCLVSNTAMGFGMRMIIVREAEGVGLQWSNMYEKASVDDPLSLGLIMGMMAVASLIHLVICLYMEQIFPGGFGVPKVWNFPFTRSFWCGSQEDVGNEDSEKSALGWNSRDSYEAEPIGKQVGLQVMNLSKAYGDHKAVTDLSLNMYKDQITVLLGHNGAGKTTTISVLTGMFPPTSGTAIINGSDIRTDLDGARTSMGICPQHNILFDDLTVRDHLIFFSCLKGLKGVELEEEVQKYIRKIGLEEKANVVSKKLSGGTQRKLSVCAAFCGGTKVVLCDEPSSGMDPSARRQLWNLLQSEKKDRTILLTTHFMDEADVLGDRIAIMAAGDLKCVGSPFFLKKKFGSGYYLICEKQEECDSDEVTILLRKYIPEIRPKSEIGAELTYRLPEKYAASFEQMLQDLESNSDELLLNGYGISITSLEEVFMRVGTERSEEIILSAQSSPTHRLRVKKSVSFNDMFVKDQPLLRGFKLMLNQWHAMILKKYYYTIRSKTTCCVQNVTPIIFIVLTVVVSNMTHYSKLKPLRLELAQYPSTTTVLETTSNVKRGSLEAKISDTYKSILRGMGSDHNLQDIRGKDFISYMLELGREIQPRINSRFIAAATVDEGKITAWLNNKPLHSAPVSLNIIHNAMARALIGPESRIVVTNAPLPYSKTANFELLKTGQNLGTQVAMNVCFCMCFVTALYGIFLIKENQSRAKLLQFVSGGNAFTFWLSHFAWDLLTFMGTALVVIITLSSFHKAGYSTLDELGRNFLFLMIFACSALPFTYLLSGHFTDPSAGFARLSIINIFLGCALFIVTLVMSFDAFDTRNIADILEKFFLIFPHFALVEGLNNLYINNQIRKFCKHNFPMQRSIREPNHSRCLPPTYVCVPYFAWDSPGILREVIYLIVTGFLFMILLFLKEYRIYDKLFFAIRQRTVKTPPPPEDGYFDEDVEHEKTRIQNMTSEEIAAQNLVLDKVTRFYNKFVAVNQISIGVQKAECFGLLGVNGAGKTTTFKLLTGDVRISSGNAYLKGLSLKTDMSKVYQEIGYCPQFDALFDDLTGGETLKVYGLLRGVPGREIPQVSRDLARSFGFRKHFDKQVRAYSGGNKRKLSAALAVLGSPSVIYLDEPTTGMDPASRRHLWNSVCRIRDSGTSIILTSHSMEECEALCTRLAIMVNGELKCIGSIQHLKNKFTKGLILKIKMRKKVDRRSTGSFLGSSKMQLPKVDSNEIMEEQTEKAIQFVAEEFPEAYLQERFQGVLTFYIPIEGILWSKMFGLMEKNKNRLDIEDYSISQTTLEEIFLQFAKYQRDDPREVK